MPHTTTLLTKRMTKNVQQTFSIFLLVLRERLSVELLNKKAKTELALELVPARSFHDVVNPPPIPTKEVPKKDARGQPVTDTSGAVVMEKIGIVKLESIGCVCWRVAID